MIIQGRKARLVNDITAIRRAAVFRNQSTQGFTSVSTFANRDIWFYVSADFMCVHTEKQISGAEKG
jgi:hypothetical protein